MGVESRMSLKNRLSVQLPNALRFLPSPLKGLTRILFDTLVLAGTPRREGSGEVGAIFLLHGLGDLIIGAPSVEALSESLHRRGLKSRLFVCQKNVRFAKAYIDVDEVVGLDWLQFAHSVIYRARVLRALASGGEYQVAYQPTVNRRLEVEDSLIRATGARDRIGLWGTDIFIKPFERYLGDRFYTCLVKTSALDQHDRLSFQDFLSALAAPPPPQTWSPLPEPSSLTPQSPYLVISSQASTPLKEWPLERFLEVARSLAGPRGWQILVVGWPDDSKLAPDLLDFRGRTDTAELAGVLNGAQLLLTNDSGPLHLGMALSVPTVAVAGGGLPGRYFPYPDHTRYPVRILEVPAPCAGCGWKCHRPQPASGAAWCVSEVTTDRVYRAAEELLAN